MITRLPFVFGAAVMAAVMAAVVIGMARPSRPPLIQKMPPFEKRWEEPSVIPKTVRTIPIAPTPRPVPVPVQPQPKPLPPQVTKEAPPKIRARTERAANDICRGKGKRYTHNKRSWRCKR